MDRLEELIGSMSKLLDKLCSIENRLAGKANADEVSSFRDRRLSVEQQMHCMNEDIEARKKCNHYGELEAKLVSIEERMKRIGSMPVADKEKDSALSDEDMIKVVVQEELNRKAEEDCDIERRKRNIIIYRVQEKRWRMFQTGKQVTQNL